MTRGEGIVYDLDPARVSHYQASLGSVTPWRGLSGKGISARRPARGRGGGAGLGTSVSASRMTDAYGASTLRETFAEYPICGVTFEIRAWSCA